MPHGSMWYMPHAPQKKGRHVMRGPRRGHARLRRMKRVPMPRGAASEVACGRLSEVSILWTGVMRTAQASIAFGASTVHERRI